MQKNYLIETLLAVWCKVYWSLRAVLSEIFSTKDLVLDYQNTHDRVVPAYTYISTYHKTFPRYFN